MCVSTHYAKGFFTNDRNASRDNCSHVMRSSAKKMKDSIFEDNSATLKLAKLSKIRPRMKHVAIKCRYSRNFIEKGIISLKHVDTFGLEVGV